MEVITTILLCTVGFLVYLVNANNNEILRLKNILRETEYLIREKDEENSSLKKQLASEKNKLLRQPAVNVNEVSRLKKEIDKNRGEIQDLKKKLNEKEKIISDLRNINSSLNLKSENEVQNLRLQFTETQNENDKLRKKILILEQKLTEKNDSYNGNENSLLQDTLKLKDDSINTSTRMVLSTLKENQELKEKISKLEQKISMLENSQVGELSLFPEVSDRKNKSQKRFVQVVFKGFSDKKHDYLLGKNKNIKVGDIVLVGTKNGARQAKVVYISEPGEFSEHAKSEVIKKVSQKI